MDERGNSAFSSPRRGEPSATEKTVVPGRATIPTQEIARPAEDDTQDDASDHRPVLGSVAVYSVATDDRVSDEARSEHGRLYLLREGDLLFVGKPPAPRQLDVGGGARRVAFAHLFPFSREYGFVSRKHLLIEMKPEGVTLLYDFSTNGIYLTAQREHRRRPPDEPVQITKLDGPDLVVLGLDLSRQRDREARVSASRHRLEILPFVRRIFAETTDPSGGSVETMEEDLP